MRDGCWGRPESKNLSSKGLGGPLWCLSSSLSELCSNGARDKLKPCLLEGLESSRVGPGAPWQWAGHTPHWKQALE